MVERGNGEETHVSDEQAEALTILSELQTLLERLPEQDPAYRDLLDRRLVAAAEALNLGLEARTIQAIGQFTEIGMKQVRAVAEEFRADDADL
ncbi:hypothetical protein [Nocardia yamanashiensis]|uniref:hypothetical protein n=1 Tax=Nocardia yamanashiensis TaxID=209247 RepID=UPI00082D6D58|nr:hypothetical protein [Nocardia yamanashiensis]